MAWLCRLSGICLLLALTAVAAAAVEPFTVGGITAPPGESVSGLLDVPAGVDEGTKIPVTVIQGTKPGPVLALIAGTHGYEYAPILALEWIRPQIRPDELAGTVILIHIANLPSFLHRTIYYSPVDGKNLNRVYPGKADGTQTERIAYTITKEVIERADYLVDMHCGDGNEALRPYAYWTRTGKADLDEASRQLALAFGLDHIVINSVAEQGWPNDPQASVYTDNTALTRGKPAITTETGQLGQTDIEPVTLALRGAWGVLAHLKMLATLGQPIPAEQVVWLDKYEVVRSPDTGVFRAATKPGYTVAQGALLGTLSDFFGNQIQEIRAPFAGVVNYVVATPPVSKGEPLAMVSRSNGAGE
jgi:predicted deacylase